MTLPGDNETSRHQHITFVLCNLVRLTGQKGFIDLDLTVLHNSVRADLIARLKDYDVIDHQILHRNHPLPAITDYRRLRSMQHRHLVQYILCPDLLDDTDQCIQNDHRQKCQIPKRAHKDQKQTKNRKNQVKICKNIVVNNLLCRL